MWIDDERPLAAVVESVEEAANLGFARVWFGQRAGWDALTLITAVGSRVPGIGLGTAVVLTWPQHPLALAGQALSTNAAVGGRLTLGIGPSHQPIVEGRYGYRWERPGQHVEDYLAALGPALTGEAGTIAVPGAARPPLLLAAHGPRLLRLAGERADGVITTWIGARGLAEHTVPAVRAAAAGRAAPQVVVGVIASLTHDPEAAREYVADRFGMASRMPSYRRSMDREGFAGPGDTVLAGDEAELEKAVRGFADAGATEFQLCAVGPEGDRARTVAFFGELARQLRA
ncbi:TIGR03564 family F420-dependent LLM class oxidoreductase [Pseudonocardia aurantiaca]